MKRIPTEIVKNRTRRLTQLFDSYAPYTDRVGREYDVLVTEVAADKQHLVGHNKYYEQILLPPTKDLLGSNVRVKIVEFGKHFMKGEIIENSARQLNFMKFLAIAVVVVAIVISIYLQNQV